MSTPTPHRVYLAGPMTTIPEFNAPAFLLAGARLRELGHEVFSPVEHDLEIGFDPAGCTGTEDLRALGYELRDFLLPDLEWIGRHAQGVYLLWGWQSSKGARAEHALAAALGLPVAEQGEELWKPADRVSVEPRWDRFGQAISDWESHRARLTPDLGWDPAREFTLQRSDGAPYAQRLGITYGRLVGLCGRKRSGKDTAARALTRLGWATDAFATTLKAMAYDIRGPRVLVPPGLCDTWPGGTVAPYQDVIDELGPEAAKMVPDVRTYLQTLGTEGGRRHLGPDVWVSTAMRRVQETRRAGSDVVVTDVRFPNEVEAIRKAGGLLVRVERPTGEDGDTHASEWAIQDVEADITLRNDGTVTDLHAALLGALADHGIDQDRPAA